MAAIQCKIDIPALPGLKENELTVGRIFLLSCEGEFPKDLAQDKLQLVVKPEEKYKLHILDHKFTSQNQAVFKVTGYTAGPTQWQDLQMTDGTQTFSLGPVQFQEVSMIPPQQPNAKGEATKQEPYGPIGPATVSVPPLYWGIFLGIIGLILLGIIFKIARVVQRRNMIQRLKEHDAALPPLAQFHQSMRKLQRTNTVFFGGEPVQTDVEATVRETHGMLRLYLTRKYQIPALEWSPRLILRDLKKHHRKMFAECGEDLRRVLKEYQHAFDAKKNVTGSDALNLSKRTRHLIETMENLS